MAQSSLSKSSKVPEPWEATDGSTPLVHNAVHDTWSEMAGKEEGGPTVGGPADIAMQCIASWR
jgi:hypothetical protein